MDEVKPTKPKWWSRPRAHSAAAGSGGRGSDTDGDFELERPAGAAPFRSVSGGSVSQEVSGGVSPPGERERVSSEPAPGERPKPLHDPDPYSTPPYGEPGPWALAPPVQHPGTTPVHGTAVAAVAPAHGTAMPGTTSGRGTPSPAYGTQGPSATAPVPPTVPVTPSPHVGHQQIPPLLPQQAPRTLAAPAESPSTSSTRTSGRHVESTHRTPLFDGQTLPAEALDPPTQVLQAQVLQAQVLQAQGPHSQGPYPQSPQPQPESPQPQAPWQNYDPWAAAPLQQNGAAVESKGARRKRAKRMLVLGAVFIGLFSGGVGGAIGAYLERNGGIDDVELPQAGTEAKRRAPDSVAGIAASALPSVVTLHVRGSGAQGTGTGFVLDERGHILTNHHVVEPAGSSGEISVTFSGGETAKGRLVGGDTGYDLAVVKVTGVSGLKPLPLGNSDNVQVGDPVVAIGAPFDLEITVTSGIISAKERPLTAGGESGDGSDVSYVDALQTDAPINPGNSGGPLVDAQARVIGINSAIRSADSGSDLEGGKSGSIGLGFAIPINQGRRVAEELINTGKATHPVIGVTLDMGYAGDGARVGAKGKDGGPAVTRGGPGDQAGIEAGDVITEVDGRRVHSGEELIVKTRAHRPGDSLELTLERGGRERKITLVLGSADGD